MLMLTPVSISGPMWAIMRFSCAFFAGMLLMPATFSVGAAPLRGQTTQSLARVNGALSVALRKLVPSPSRARLTVLRAEPEASALEVRGSYARRTKLGGVAILLRRFAYDASVSRLEWEGELIWDHSVGESLGIGSSWFDPAASYSAQEIESEVRTRLAGFLGPVLKSAAAISVGVDRLQFNLNSKQAAWHITPSYELMAEFPGVTFRSGACDLHIFPQKIAGRCHAELQYSVSEPFRQFVRGLLDGEAQATQWWVDFIQAWDAWVRTELG